MLGSISAQAEEPTRQWPSSLFRRVDLRAGGGARRTRPLRIGYRGRSPRRRRSPHNRFKRSRRLGSISAQAEEPTAVSRQLVIDGVDLRAGGGAVFDFLLTDVLEGRSPRRRRSRTQRGRSASKTGSISAQAEEPPLPMCSNHSFRVDLRAGGGAKTTLEAWLILWGRSPRRRRSQPEPVDVAMIEGSISAQAEEPPGEQVVFASDGVDLRAGGGASTAQEADFVSFVKEHESTRARYSTNKQRTFMLNDILRRLA